MPASVVALLVSHDGARWLPTVLDRLAAQTRRPDRVLAVDTGSKDESPALLEAAGIAVTRLPGSTGFPAAVRAGLDAAGPRDRAEEWVWILHDDASPDPGCLAALLDAAQADPTADVLGPKLREWPSLRRLLEVGVTISGTGRRETGLERGEYDQGQHDGVREVLAVNTAGMLVRRRVLEDLGGFDDALPIFGNDVDFGWRAAAAGHRTLVVPQAVVFHAEAAHRGVRRTPLTGRHTHYQERRAALHTLLANSPGRRLPFQVVRLALGTVLRFLGFLLLRSVGQALDELAALVSVFASPGEIRAARRARRALAPDPDERVGRLLAPWWVPYRHGLDLLSDLAAALTHQAADVAERRRAAAALRDPSSFAARRGAPPADDDLGTDAGWVARFLTNPVAVLLAVVVAAMLIGARAGFGPAAGGGLAPAPESVGEWWRLWAEGWHQLGPGTAVPAPAYLPVLAVLGTVLLGSATAAVSVVLVLAAPCALWGAWRFLRVVGRLVSPQGAPRWLILIGATTYALAPIAPGAWGDGRIGVLLAAAALPWLAHAALGFADPEPDRRWRAAWRSGLLLALVSAGTPVAWLVALAIGVVVLAAAALVVRSAVRERSVWGPPAVAVGVVPVLLAPWWVPALVAGAGEALLLDSGRLPGPSLAEFGLVLGRLVDAAAPGWPGALLLVLAVLALVPRATRVPVLVCWVVTLVIGAVTAALGAVSLDLAAVSVGTGPGFGVLAVQGTLVTAVVLGGQGLLSGVAGRRGALRAVPAAAGAVAALVPVVTLGWFAAGGAGDLDEDPAAGIPAYMRQSAESDPGRGILVLRGTEEDGLTWVIRRGDGVTLGQDEILALTAEDRDLTRDVRALVSRPTPAVVDRLAEAGVEYVVLPAPADGEVAAVLDSADGLVPASAEDRATRAWRLDRDLVPDALADPRSFPETWLRPALLVLQVLALVAVLVLAAPTSATTRERRRS